MASMTKTKAPSRGGASARRPRRAAQNRHTRLIDLTGPKLYAMIVYRLSMTVIISLVILKTGVGS